MDIAIAVEKLLGTGVKFRRADTYQALVNTWEDERPVPTLQQLQVAYTSLEMQPLAAVQLTRRKSGYIVNRQIKSVLNKEIKTSWLM